MYEARKMIAPSPPRERAWGEGDGIGPIVRCVKCGNGERFNERESMAGVAPQPFPTVFRAGPGAGKPLEKVGKA